MASFELEGKLIARMDTKQITNNFRVREFVIKTESAGAEGAIYTEEVKLQGINDLCDELDRHNQGDMVKAHFDIKGKRYEKPGKPAIWFNNLNCWKLESITMK